MTNARVMHDVIGFLVISLFDATGIYMSHASNNINRSMIIFANFSEIYK